MKRSHLATLAFVPLLLCGCLEVEQHPGWRQGKYNGKPDNLPQQAHFHNDRLAWMAAINDRNHRQNEYERAHPISELKEAPNGPAQR
jgi:hypothetical protein